MYNQARVRTGSSTAALYRQSIPAIHLSLERATENVPNDGWFYVLLRDEIKGRFRTKSEALALYRTLLSESGYTPPPVEPSSRNETVERYLDDLEAYWTESHRHHRRGGKTMYRG